MYMYGYQTYNEHKLPACVIAHLVEHSTTIVEVMVFIPVQA